MTWQWTVHQFPLGVGVLLSIALAVYISEISSPAAVERTGIVIGCRVPGGCCVRLWNWVLPSWPTKSFGYAIQYFGIAFLPTIWIIYAILYTGHSQWLHTPQIGGADYHSADCDSFGFY